MNEYNPLIDEVHNLISYDPITGFITLKRNNRRLFADFQGYLHIRFPVPNNKLLKVKADKIACFFGLGVFPNASQKVLHKNLDESDNRLCNLSVVPKILYLKIKEALLNLNGDLRISAHPTDQFVYFVFYRENKLIKRELCADIIAAQELYRKIELSSAKLVTEYVNSNI